MGFWGFGVDYTDRQDGEDGDFGLRGWRREQLGIAGKEMVLMLHNGVKPAAGGGFQRCRCTAGAF